MATKKARTKKQIESDPCGCIDSINETLKPRGVQLHVSLAILTGRRYMRIEVEKIEGASRRAVNSFCLTPTFCPFCGKKLKALVKAG